MDEDNGFLKDEKISTVRAAITSYQDKFGEGIPTIKKFQTNHQEHSKARELRQAKRETDRFRQTRKLAESAAAEAESSLFEAKNAVKNLARRIEETNSRTKFQTHSLEKLRMSSKHMECEDSPAEKVMIELESMKRELSRVKLDMASVLEEKRRAEEEARSSETKLLSYKGSIEKLNKEIEEANEENVLVELARIEAVKEREEVESKRREEAEKHAAEVDALRKKNLSMAEEIEDAKEIEEKLAITVADIDMLERELKQVKEYEKDGQESNEGTASIREGESKLESLRRESEASTKELALVKEEIFQFMTSMDAVRKEIRRVMEETAKSKKREERTEMTIQNLNSKLLRAKSKLESTSASAEKTKSIASNLTMTFEHLRSETESARKEQSRIIEEAAMIEERGKESEANIESAEEKVEAALQELKALKSSEAAALEKLRGLIEETMKRRSLMVSKIRISKFEYNYLKGNASEAIEIADKKVEASHAWVEALRARETEMLIRADFLKRQSREDKAEKEADGGEDDFEKWIRQKREHQNDGNKATVYQSGKAAAAATSSKRGKPRRFSSPAIHGTPRSSSFTVRMRKR